MAYYTYTKDPIGAFVEKEAGNVFEYSINNESWASHLGEDMPHKIWVGGGQINDSGWRFANVRKTVAAVVVDEDEFGLPVIEKWFIKNHRVYNVAQQYSYSHWHIVIAYWNDVDVGQ